MKHMVGPYVDALDGINPAEIKRIAQIMNDTVAVGGRIFTVGNGGSHYVAQHFASDLMKPVGIDVSIKPVTVICLTDNVALLTAISNDVGYDDSLAMAAQLHGLGDRDVVVGFSVSGNSRNIVNLFEIAYMGLAGMVKITGQAFGNRRYPQWTITERNCHVTVETALGKATAMHYYVCESVFSCIAHMIANEFHILRGNYVAEAYSPTAGKEEEGESNAENVTE